MSRSTKSRIHDYVKPLKLKAGWSFRRELNGALNRLQARKLQNAHVLGYPKHLMVDPTNICNLKCPLCPSGKGALKRPTGFMDLKLFKKLMDETGPYIYTLTLANWGEPLLHPKLTDMIAYAKRYKIYVGFSSNFHHLKEETAEKLIEARLDEVAVSLDGVTPETYRKVRAGGNLETVMKNLELLIETRRRKNSSLPRIRWQFLVTSQNEHEMKAAEEKAKEMGLDSVVFVPIYLDIGGLLCRPPDERYARESEWLPSHDEHRLYDPKTGRLKNEPDVCLQLWEAATVNWDGGVSPCCAVIDEKDDFGKFGPQTFKQIWNNEKYKAARKLMKGCEIDEKMKIICRFCRKFGIPIF